MYSALNAKRRAYSFGEAMGTGKGGSFGQKCRERGIGIFEERKLRRGRGGISVADGVCKEGTEKRDERDGPADYGLCVQRFNIPDRN